MTPNNTNNEHRIYCRHPERDKFIAVCRLNGTKAQDVLYAMIDEYLERNGGSLPQLSASRVEQHDPVSDVGKVKVKP